MKSPFHRANDLESQLELIASVLFANCPTPSLKDVKIPAGRTAKACTHVLHKFKNDYFKKSNGEETSDAANLTSAPPSPIKSTPAKAAATPRKRKAAGESKAAKKVKSTAVVEEEDDNILDDDNDA